MFSFLLPIVLLLLEDEVRTYENDWMCVCIRKHTVCAQPTLVSIPTATSALTSPSITVLHHPAFVFRSHAHSTPKTMLHSQPTSTYLLLSENAFSSDSNTQNEMTKLECVCVWSSCFYSTQIHLS
ncbi:hypothetical protein BpHYR1_017290 [Brachionus plicatilis]|uniref:Secreted protein n=1 Tax=Brachionus plicatilis TaxID=10195 RepID=A0A3M7QV20_BRAPC|nr:hypothetical protein BpHYR1_017290 [Brachionus plicatilis]